MNERQEEILASIRQGQRVRVRELAERFGVSEMTIRRDLTGLEAQGLLIRTHGGGAPVSRLRAPDGALTPVSPEKVAIGWAAAGLAAPGETVMVDAGTTALQVARHLPRDAGLTVVTTSLLVAQELYGAGLHLLLLGGFLRSDFPGLYGPLTESALASLRVDVLFMGCDGASAEEGFYTADLHLLSLERAMIAAAARVVLVTESAKFGRRALARFATPDQVHTLVTDTGLVPRDRERLEEQGVRLLLTGSLRGRE